VKKKTKKKEKKTLSLPVGRGTPKATMAQTTKVSPILLHVDAF
jgi:hypothetical protein